MSPAERARLVRRLDVWADLRRDYRLTLGGRPISFATLDDETLFDHAGAIAGRERLLRSVRDQNRRIAA